MRVLVTGAGGFVGRRLVQVARDAGDHLDAPSSAEIDLTRDGSLDVLGSATYDRIYHLAAWTRPGRFCQERGGDQWIVNQQINTNVLAWWQRRQPQAKLVAFGTSASYAGSGVHHEEDYLAGVPPEAYFAYAMTKRMLLAGLMELGRQHGLRWLYLVPSTVYGPDYHADGRELHFVYDLARKIVRGREHGEEVVLWGDGSQRRELVHVDDVVHATTTLPGITGEQVINVGAGADHSIREIATELCALADYDIARVRFDPERFVGARDKVLATDRLRSLIGPHTDVALRDGLAQVVAWVEGNAAKLG